MKYWVALPLIVAVPSAAIAQDDCWRSGQLDIWNLAMAPPKVAQETVLLTPTAARKGLVIARQEYALVPIKRYLASDINLTDGKGKSLSSAVPLAAGSPITTWRGADGDRHCSIGWKNGLFGGAAGDGHYRWICLEDRDGDGKFDNAWRSKTGNMGLSYSRLDMPISPQIGWTDTPPATENAKAKNGPLESYPASRTIEVSGLSKKSVQIQYWGVGLGRSKENKIELPIDKESSATLGGITITVTPTGKGTATLTSSGSFEPQAFNPICGDSSYMIGSFDSRVVFSFPNW